MARVKTRENISGLALKKKISIRYKEHLREFKSTIDEFRVKHPKSFAKVVNYSFTSSMLSFPLTIWFCLAGFGKWYWFFPLFFSLSFFLPIFEHYFIWFKKGWLDDYSQVEDENDTKK